jgi:hypothetical protein
MLLFVRESAISLINNQRAEQAYLNAIRTIIATVPVFLRYAQVVHRKWKIRRSLA